MIRLLLATYAYPPSIGGVERHSRSLARALVARGHSVHVVTAATTDAPSREDDDGVTIRRVAAGSGSRWSKMATYLRGMLRETVALRETYDVIHVQQALFPAAAMAVAATTLRKPLVVRSSGSGHHGAVQLMTRLPLGRSALGLIRRAATTVSLSSDMTAELRAVGFKDVVEIPNGVVVPPVLTERADARRQLGIPASARVVLYVGRLDAEKGTALLARAWREVTMPEALLLVAGDGPQRDLLAGPGIRHLGFVTNVEPCLAAADVFVLPSESEGISNALLEAMAAERAVVATAVGGNREVISTPEVGSLVPPDHPTALANELMRVLVDRDAAGRMGRAARQHVSEQWSFDRMVDAYEQLYARLSGAR